MREPTTIPVPDPDAICDANTDPSANPDPRWHAVRDAVDNANISGNSYGYTVGFADAWIYIHANPDLLQPAVDDRDANPDPVAVADAVARTVCNAPGHSGNHPAELARIYANAWRAAYRAAVAEHGGDGVAAGGGGFGSGSGGPGIEGAT